MIQPFRYQRARFALASFFFAIACLALAAPDLYVANYRDGRIIRLNHLGQVADIFGFPMQAHPNGATLGTDGLLYVSNNGISSGIVRYQPTTGVFADVFLSNFIPDYGDVRFGADGFIYIAGGDHVGRYDGGAHQVSGIVLPDSGLVGLRFGPNGHLFACDSWNSRIFEIDPFGQMELLATFGGPELHHPTFMTVRDDNLFVSNYSANQILRYDLYTHQFLGVFSSDPSLIHPDGIAFGEDGNLYVASGQTNAILKFDGNTGRLIGPFSAGHPINEPSSITFGPPGIQDPLILPSLIKVRPGVIPLGNNGIESLYTGTDGIKYEGIEGLVLSSSQDPLVFTVTGIALATAPSSLSLSLVNSATQAHIQERAEAYNFNSNQYDLLGIAQLNMTSQHKVYQISSPREHVGPDGIVLVRLRYRSVNSFPVPPWAVLQDEIRWRYSP